MLFTSGHLGDEFERTRPQAHCPVDPTTFEFRVANASTGWSSQPLGTVGRLVASVSCRISGSTLASCNSVANVCRQLLGQVAADNPAVLRDADK